MDRILDSGSNDWGSTPHGRTIIKMIKRSHLFRLIFVAIVLLTHFAVTKAQSHTFKWSDPSSLTPSFPVPDNSNRAGDIVSGCMFTSGPVTAIINDEDAFEEPQKARFYWGYMTMTVELRIYGGSVINISVPETETIREVIFSGTDTTEKQIRYDGNQGIMSGSTWTATQNDNVTKLNFNILSSIKCTSTVVRTSTSGINETLVDLEDKDKSWYNLQGVRLPSTPTTKGYYICKSATGAVKVFFEPGH